MSSSSRDITPLVTAPRWTPRPSPTTTTTVEIKSLASEEDDVSFSSPSMDRRSFPFSSFASSSQPDHHDHKAPSFASDDPVGKSVVDQMGKLGGDDHKGSSSFDRDGICLTWKDLRVTASDRKNGNPMILLDGLTGYAEPGQVLAIMGPSGCGKSTLLDALAGMFNG